MPRPVYSTRFILANLATGGTTTASYTVPAGKTCVIRSWGYGKRTTPVAAAYLEGGPAAGFLLDALSDNVVAITAINKQLNGIVLNAGDLIIARVVTGSIAVNVCGYLLSAV